jgi:hypothetical protein
VALSAYGVWEILASGGSDNNGGGFDPSQTAGMLTDGAATSATGTAPVFSSASYSFVSGDVGAYVYIASGTNWIPGWYKISSVAGGAATLDATAGHALLAAGSISTTNGCATTGSPSSATWSIDYSCQSSAQVSFTDLVIGATTTHLTSAANPFGAQWVGNILQVTSGTNFTTGFYCIQSISSGAAVMDRSVGTAAASSGHAAMGGAWATWAHLTTMVPVGGNTVWQKGTIAITSQQTISSAPTAGTHLSIRGYGTYRGDTGHAALSTATNSIAMVGIGGSVNGIAIEQIDLTNTAGTPGNGFRAVSANSGPVVFNRLVISGCNIGIEANYSVDWAFNPLWLIQVEVKSCVSHGVQNTGLTVLIGCYLHGNGGDGMQVSAGNTGLPNSVIAICTVSAGNSANGFNDAGTSGSRTSVYQQCVAYNNTDAGILVQSQGSGSGTQQISAINCILYDNGTYGINFTSIVGAGVVPSACVQLNNAFGANGTAARNSGAPSDPSDVTLSANPFTSPSTGDFTLNATSGGGAACTGAGWQSAIL